MVKLKFWSGARIFCIKIVSFLYKIIGNLNAVKIKTIPKAGTQFLKEQDL